MKEVDKSKRIRKQLTEALNADTPDYGRIQSLAAELAEQDPDQVRFSVDAGIISRLGRELVARQETAVAELIKNAYDADAKTVKLTFENADKRGGTLTISDDGLGMTREQLVSGFMRLSSAEKIREPISPLYQRKRAGRKGIGRFAVQRLGEQLEITTQTANSDIATRVEINWNLFATGKNLFEIANSIKEVKRQDQAGTTIKIIGLRDSWSEAEVRRVFRYTSDLIQPFPLSISEPQSKKANIDPGFKVEMFRREKGRLQSIVSEETEIFSQALAVIEGEVDSKGKGTYSISSDKLGIRETGIKIGRAKSKTPASFETLKDVRFRSYYYIYNAGLIPPSLNSYIRELADVKGGIRIYRNGFYVPPYGRLDDDWLGLDASTRAREILPPHANTNFFGFVEIYDPDGSQFEETSSREGLLENQAFSDLRDFVSGALKGAALRIAEIRGRKQTASQKDWQKKASITPETLRAAADKLEKNLAPEPPPLFKDERVSNSNAAIKEVAEQLKATAAIQESLLEELGMLRVLASLGITIGEFTHEIKHSLNAAIQGSARLVERVRENPKDKQNAENLKSNLDRIRSYAGYFEKSLSDNASRSLAPQSLHVVVKGFVKATTPAAASRGVQMENPILDDPPLFSCPMHASEWASILFNLYTNSIKAIKRARGHGKILIKAGREDENVYLEFADDGDGIPEENEYRIFDAFFTTTAPDNYRMSENEEMQGMGLGLKIVRDIVTSHNGDIYLISPPSGFSTCFRIDLPQATDKELEAYGY